MLSQWHQRKPAIFSKVRKWNPNANDIFDEFRRALKNSNAKNIIDFYIENWSKNILTAPSEHKNYLHGKAQNIKCKIFCAMNTSLAYLGKKALIAARIEAGLSQAKIASIMKVSQSSVARFESCEFGDFKFSTFEKYLNACGKDFAITLK